MWSPNYLTLLKKGYTSFWHPVHKPIFQVFSNSWLHMQRTTFLTMLVIEISPISTMYTPTWTMTGLPVIVGRESTFVLLLLCLFIVLIYFFLIWNKLCRHFGPLILRLRRNNQIQWENLLKQKLSDSFEPQ